MILLCPVCDDHRRLVGDTCGSCGEQLRAPAPLPVIPVWQRLWFPPSVALGILVLALVWNPSVFEIRAGVHGKTGEPTLARPATVPLVISAICLLAYFLAPALAPFVHSRFFGQATPEEGARIARFLSILLVLAMALTLFRA